MKGIINMEKVVIYTDGACSGNPGPGGWAAVLMYKIIRRKYQEDKKILLIMLWN